MRAMASAYAGPIREERLAVELHNTIYAAGGAGVDAFDDPDQARAWLAEIDRRAELAGAPAGDGPGVEGLRALRGAVRDLVAATVEGAPLDPAAVAVLNARCAAAPAVPRLALEGAGSPVRTTGFGAASRADVVLATLAGDAIDLLAGPDRDELRVCGAPGCVLAFLRTHPRREWCSNGCGNRARQARHYRRVRGGAGAA